MHLQLKSYAVTDKCNVVITRPRWYDVKYVQAIINLKDVAANEAVLDIPIGPPLTRAFQIFQIRMISESTKAEYALHINPYRKCDKVDWIFHCVTNAQDEMLQETWLFKPDSICDEPYLYFSFRELAGITLVK